MPKLLIALIFFSCLKVHANVRGSDLQNFNPNYSGLDFLSVHSSRTLAPLELNVGGFLNYSTNSLAYSTTLGNNGTQKFSEPSDKLLYSNVHFGLGVLQGWDIGLGAGFINSQDIDQSSFLFSYGDTGINDVLLTSKVRLFTGETWGLAFVLGSDFDQIKNNPFAGDNAGPSFNFEGVLDLKIMDNWLWAINLGYRMRIEGTPIQNTGVRPMSDQFIYSSALAYTMASIDSSLIGEIYGSYPFEVSTLPTDRQLSNLEMNLSYKWSPYENLDIHGGVGTELYHGLGSPDFRALVGVNFRHDFLQNSAPLAEDDSTESSPVETAPVQSEPLEVVPPQDNIETEEKPMEESTLPTKTTSHDSDQDGVADELDRCPGTKAGVSVSDYGCEKKEIKFNQNTLESL